MHRFIYRFLPSFLGSLFVWGIIVFINMLFDYPVSYKIDLFTWGGSLLIAFMFAVGAS